MKIAEPFVFSDLLTKASQEPDPAKRMANIVSFISATQWVLNNRVSKPFISMLGETYELVTPKFKFVAECVKSLPCMVAYHVSGDGFESYKTCQSKMSFTGTQVAVSDPNKTVINLFLKDGTSETYTFEHPRMVVGNMMMGTRYIEACGKVLISAPLAEADLEFHGRAWTSNYYTNRIDAEVRMNGEAVI